MPSDTDLSVTDITLSYDLVIWKKDKNEKVNG